MIATLVVALSYFSRLQSFRMLDHEMTVSFTQKTLPRKQHKIGLFITRIGPGDNREVNRASALKNAKTQTETHFALADNSGFMRFSCAQVTKVGRHF